jgi:hypothetical protein
MPKCPQCNQTVREQDNHCPNCGEQIGGGGQKKGTVIVDCASCEGKGQTNQGTFFFHTCKVCNGSGKVRV